MIRKLFILSLMMVVSAVAALPAATVPLDHWAYELADELIIRGLWAGEDYGERPWTRATFAEAVGYLEEQRLRGEVGLHRATRGMLERLLAEFAPEVELWRSDRGPADRADHAAEEVFEPQLELGARVRLDGGYRLVEWELPPGLGGAVDIPPEPVEEGFHHRERFYPLLGAGYGDELALWARAEADTDGLRDEDWRGLEWKAGISAQFDYGYLSWNPTDWFRAWAGRDQVQWGRGLGGSLLLSGRAPATDGFGYTVDLGPLRFSYFHSSLDIWREDYGGERHYFNRYLTGHRLAWNIAPGVVIGLGEATVYGGEGRALDLSYLNPLMLHYVEQLSGRVHNDNPFWQIDFDIVPVPGYRLWGQLMIDDYQYEDDPEPPHIGFLAGGGWADPFSLPGLTLELEYLKVWNWTYNVLPDHNKLLYLDRPLGYPGGNDADRWSVRLSWVLDAAWSAGLDVAFERKGEGRITDEWAAKGFRSEPFPSGIVEETRDYRFEAAWTPSRSWELGAAISYTRADNYDNRPDAVNGELYGGLWLDYLVDWR